MKELIELLRYTELNGDRDPQNYVTNMCGSCYLCEQAADALEELEKQVPKWIPVTERLPEYGQRVIAHSGGVVAHTVHFCYFWNKDYDSWQRVTHWMPLPEPPKEEKHA